MDDKWEDSSLPPEASWKRDIQDPVKCITQSQISYGQMMKLVGLGLRMKNYVTKSKKEGKEPFIDPFGTQNVTTNKGVPCGGIGCGTILRSFKGDFNSFYLNPGKPQFHTVKADQFSLYVKREELPSKVVVLGNPYPKYDPNDNNDTIEMPRAEPLPGFIADQLEENSADETQEEVKITEKEEKEEQKQNEQKQNEQKKKLKTIFIKPEDALQDWNWKSPNGEYSGCFPRSWTDYDVKHLDKRLKISCKQISPVIPNNYKESSYPVCLFVWSIENTHPKKSIDVSLMFTFQNGTGQLSDYKGGHKNQKFQQEEEEEENDIIGIELIHNKTKTCVEGENFVTYKDPLSFGIASKKADKIQSNGEILPISDDDCQLSSVNSFQTTSHGDQLWRSFSLTGKAILPDNNDESIEGIGIGSAVANKVKVEANSKVEIVFSLAWDHPIVRFGEGRGVHPRYTKFYGISGNNVQQICKDSLNQWRLWDEEINKWQMPIINDKNLPNWYKKALFNELYYIVAGGSLWIDKEESKETKLSYQIEKTKNPYFINPNLSNNNSSSSSFDLSSSSSKELNKSNQSLKVDKQMAKIY